MVDLNIPDLPEATHHALQQRAAQHGRTPEAEIHAILDEVLTNPSEIKLGSLLATISQRFGGVDLEIVHDHTPAEPASFD